MPTPKTSPRSARSAKPANRSAKTKAKSKTKTKAKAKPAVKAAPIKPKDRLSAATDKARKAVEPEIERLKKASVQVEERLKSVSSTVAAKLAALEELAEQQLKSDKNKARLNKLEKDVDRLITSADQQFGKVRGALDAELKDLRALIDRSADRVIPAAKARLQKLMPAEGASSSDTWEFYTDKSKKWRWRLKDSSGNPVGASNKAFPSRAACVENASRLGYRGG